MVKIGESLAKRSAGCIFDPMDSLSQIVLGAACGEVVLGRKVGNRAMFWGAVAGTIPDLDIIANLFTDPISAMAMHRGISHSFFFAFTAPILFGWLVSRFYSTGIHQKKWFRRTKILFWLLLVWGAINGGLYRAGGQFSLPVFLWSSAGALGLGLLLEWLYVRPEQSDVAVSWKSWAWLFFWAILTHPLLDSCTAYGTQLFQPFSDYRVAFDNISVVDPLYTLPFLLCLIGASILTRRHPWRGRVNQLGLVLSCGYLLLTFFHKHRVNEVFEAALEREQITYSRLITTPTILNNLLWQGLAEGDTAFYYGQYSLLDPEPVVRKITVFPKQWHLLDGHQDDKDIQTMKWFTDGLYNVTERPDGRLMFIHMKYGLMGPQADSSANFVWFWMLEEKEDGSWTGRTAPEDRMFDADDFRRFRERVFGNPVPD